MVRKYQRSNAYYQGQLGKFAEDTMRDAIANGVAEVETTYLDLRVRIRIEVAPANEVDD